MPRTALPANMVYSAPPAPRVVKGKSVKYARPIRRSASEPSPGAVRLGLAMTKLLDRNISDLSSEEVRDFGNMRLYGILYADDQGMIRTTRLGETFRDR